MIPKRKKQLFIIAKKLLYTKKFVSLQAQMITKIYNDNPNQREVRRVADLLQQGGIVVLPTDTLYAFACSMEFKRSVETIAQLKGFSLKKAKYSMLCSSLSMASEYVRPMSKDLFSLLKQCLPWPIHFCDGCQHQCAAKLSQPEQNHRCSGPLQHHSAGRRRSLGLPPHRHLRAPRGRGNRVRISHRPRTDS